MLSAFLVSGCGGSNSSNTTTPTSAVATSNANAVMQIAKDAAGNDIVVAKNGMALYSFDPDTKGGNSVCYGGCAKAWPPLISPTATPVVSGIAPSMIGTVTRKDGSKQVTLNGWPMYYFAFDQKAGDTNGQSDQQIWWLMKPDGNQIRMPATVQAAAKGGKIVTDNLGWVLYIFQPDGGKGTSVCNGKCAAAWPPVTTTGDPIAGSGLDSSKLSTFKRSDGAIQVVYNGWPLYYWAKDSSPGETTGQGVGGLWWMLTPAGAPLKK
jgi:predicted lipoprotein with Yx(FWY)xxD motif